MSLQLQGKMKFRDVSAKLEESTYPLHYNVWTPRWHQPNRWQWSISCIGFQKPTASKMWEIHQVVQWGMLYSTWKYGKHDNNTWFHPPTGRICHISRFWKWSIVPCERLWKGGVWWWTCHKWYLLLFADLKFKHGMCQSHVCTYCNIYCPWMYNMSFCGSKPTTCSWKRTCP